MKRLLFVLFSVVCPLMYGQDFFVQLSMSYAADTSIIRWYQPGLCVLYTGSASRGNHFHLVNTGSGDIYTFEVNEEVTDMEILDDTLYYCGNVSGYYPALYYFPLMQLYSSNVVVRGIRHSPIMSYNPRKLEVFRATGGVHAVVVGDIEGMNRTDGFIADYWKPASSLFFTILSMYRVWLSA